MDKLLLPEEVKANLRALADYTEEHEKVFHMSTWMSRKGNNEDEITKETGCGYTACLATNTLLMRGWRYKHSPDRCSDDALSPDGIELGWDKLPDKAAELLGIDRDWIFCRGYWPWKYQWMAVNQGDAAAAVKLLRDLADGTEELASNEYRSAFRLIYGGA